MTSIGLLVIFAGWLFQLGRLRRGKQVSPSFVALYSLGVLLLIIDGFKSGAGTIVYLNILTLVGALMVFHALTKK